MIIYLSGSSSPDVYAVENKERIDVSFNSFDVSASSETSILPNYTTTGQIVIPGQSDVNGYTYYTPVYTEKLNYEVWKSTVNKNFQELN